MTTEQKTDLYQMIEERVKTTDDVIEVVKMLVKLESIDAGAQFGAIDMVRVVMYALRRVCEDEGRDDDVYYGANMRILGGAVARAEKYALAHYVD